jgi:hypothetical protein
MSDLLANLNAPQLQAVTLPPVHALILAGAGSGKTRVLTTRIAWLMSTSSGWAAWRLAVTFTNKAAKEMTARLSALVPINTRGMWIGTFHGLCNRLLRAHYREAGLPQTFQILDSGDQLSMVKRLLKNLNVDDEKFPPRELCHFINATRSRGFGLRRPRLTTITRRSASSCTPSMKPSATVKAWLISPNCSCAAMNCCSATSHCASIIRSASATSWSTSSGHQSAAIQPGCNCWPVAAPRFSRWVTTTRASTLSRRRGRQYARFRARLRGRQRHSAGAELPFARQYPGRRQRADQE